MPRISSTAKPATLCEYQLSTGKPCRQITLKGDNYCRHHRRLFRQSEAEAIRLQSMQRLAVKLSSLPTPDLLEALYRKLYSVHSTARTVPEAALALGITMHRLRAEIGASPEAFETPMNFPEKPLESMN